jgi:very-short-patch-repair endonuclease
MAFQTGNQVWKLRKRIGRPKGIPWNDEERRIKHSKWMKANYPAKDPEIAKKIGLANSISLKGCKHTEEHIKNSLRRREKSSLEQKFENICQEYSLPYKFVGNGAFFIERKNPDFINCNGEKIAVEVYYRRHKQQFKVNIETWKQERQEIFSRYGWKVIFFDETQVNEKEILKTLKQEGE